MSYGDETPEPDPLASFPRFASDVRSRLEAGARAYGDKSFSAEPAVLLEEIRQELLDVCGWAFVLATRLEAIAAALPADGLRVVDVVESAPAGNVEGTTRGRLVGAERGSR